MKKLAVTILSIITILSVQGMGMKVVAANIDEAIARQYGTYYLSVMVGGKVADESQVTLAYKFMNKDLNIPAAYVFNVDEQGFVIVSGSDLWYPILGYSTEGLLDTNRMAPAFKLYFEGLCEYIIYSQNTGRMIIENIAEEWDALRYQKLEPMATVKAQYWLMDAAWGQGTTWNPTYNKYCPHKTVDGAEQTAYVGCVSTAMSQIMHYWKYPTKPMEGHLQYACMLDSVHYEDVDIDMSEVSYNFDMMPNQLTKTSTEAEIDAIALLCYHAGVSVEMSYGLAVSLAYSNTVGAAMRDVFLYDEGVEYLERTQTTDEDAPQLFTNEEWDAMMTAEIDAGRPMYYSGYTKTGEGRDAAGHAFVCDGKHPSNGKYHFNWGWDGQPNVWSDVRNNSLAVADYNFKYHQEMVRYIQPRGHEGIDMDEVRVGAAYPNPTTSTITIGYNIKRPQNAKLSVYNIKGELIEVIKLGEDANKVTIDVSDYPKGVYVYRLGGVAQKFIVR